MSSTAAVNNTAVFKNSLLSDPRIVFRKFYLEVIGYASSRCTEITGPTGLLAWLLTPAQWAAVPGNSVLNGAGVVVVAPIYDIITPLNVPNGAAANATVKLYDIDRSDRQTVIQEIQLLKSYLVQSLPASDLSELSDPTYGMLAVSVVQIFTHLHGNYNVLNQEDFNVIFTRLQAPKLPIHDYSTLAEIHRDLHALLAGAGQPSTELAKTTYFIDALKADYQGREAVAIYIRAHPLMAARTFVDLVTTVILHAPTIVITPVSLGYSNAPSAEPAYGASSLDELGMAQLIAKTQKDLAALKRRNGTATAPTVHSSPGTPLMYCYKHGYQRTHAGKNCKLMKANPLLYQGPQLNATDHHNPAGGNTVSRG